MRPYYTLEMMDHTGEWYYHAEYKNLGDAITDARFRLEQKVCDRQARIKNQFGDIVASF